MTLTLYLKDRSEHLEHVSRPAQIHKLETGDPSRLSTQLPGRCRQIHRISVRSEIILCTGPTRAAKAGQ